MIDDRTVGRSSADEANSAIGSAASDIKAAAGRSYTHAMAQVRSRADGAKDDMANEIRDVASALRRASEEQRGGSAQERTLGRIAGGLDDASKSIRDRDLGEIAAVVGRLGRENPALFLGGAALLGFVASRYAKARATPQTRPDAGPVPDREAQVRDFVDEGNPNSQPAGAAP